MPARKRRKSKNIKKQRAVPKLTYAGKEGNYVYYRRPIKRRGPKQGKLKM